METGSPFGCGPARSSCRRGTPGTTPTSRSRPLGGSWWHASAESIASTWWAPRRACRSTRVRRGWSRRRGGFGSRRAKGPMGFAARRPSPRAASIRPRKTRSRPGTRSGAERMSGPRAITATYPTRSHPMQPSWSPTGPGTTRSRSATSGARTWALTGAPTATAAGSGRPTDGPGFLTSPGAGPRSTSAAGASRGLWAGTGCPELAGDQRGSRGPWGPGTWAGAPWGATTVPSWSTDRGCSGATSRGPGTTSREATSGGRTSRGVGSRPLASEARVCGSSTRHGPTSTATSASATGQWRDAVASP
jgi:hypothetical protein